MYNHSNQSNQLGFDFPRQFLLIFVVSTLSLLPASSLLSHEDATTHFECHDVTDDQDEDDDSCHCHTPGEDPADDSCEDGLPTMEFLLELLDPDEEDAWYGLTVAEESTCTPYDRDHYTYGPKLDVLKSYQLDGMWAAYEKICYDDYRDVQIEHLVAVKEAHDSGLCRADYQTKINFANDLDNIALASASVNRSKSDKDPAEWLPDNNECWYVWQHMKVKRKYDLTIDRSEQRAIARILSDCTAEDLRLEIDDSCTLPDEED